MSSFASEISRVLYQKTNLQSRDDFNTAAQTVSDFRYSLIRERDQLPNLLQDQLPEEITKQQADYGSLSATCQK